MWKFTPSPVILDERIHGHCADKFVPGTAACARHINSTGSDMQSQPPPTTACCMYTRLIAIIMGQGMKKLSNPARREGEQSRWRQFFVGLQLLLSALHFHLPIADLCVVSFASYASVWLNRWSLLPPLRICYVSLVIQMWVKFHFISSRKIH